MKFERILHRILNCLQVISILNLDHLNTSNKKRYIIVTTLCLFLCVSTCFVSRITQILLAGSSEKNQKMGLCLT